jgi:hypothetical protein
MGKSSDQFVYRGIPGSFCRSQNNGSAILSLPIWEITIKKVAKYGIGKRSVKLVFTNILKFVIDIPLPGSIVSACLCTSYVGIVSVTISWGILLINDNLYGIIIFLLTFFLLQIRLLYIYIYVL